jgi:hypothetical protein
MGQHLVHVRAVDLEVDGCRLHRAEVRRWRECIDTLLTLR